HRARPSVHVLAHPALSVVLHFFLPLPPPPTPTLFPYTTLFRSAPADLRRPQPRAARLRAHEQHGPAPPLHGRRHAGARNAARGRSEEHTSELQSRENLVCRLLLEKKNKDRHTCMALAIEMVQAR